MTDVDIGDVARVAMAFLDEDDALETPTGVTVLRREPDDTDTTITSPNAAITLGKVFPLRIRQELARNLFGIEAADLAAGVGCVEYTHTPTQTGSHRYVGKATAPTVSAARAFVTVHANFDD